MIVSTITGEEGSDGSSDEEDEVGHVGDTYACGDSILQASDKQVVMVLESLDVLVILEQMKQEMMEEMMSRLKPFLF